MARAWHRLRIEGGVATREEAAAAHAARAAVGRAIRDARWRRANANVPATFALAPAIPLVRESALLRSRAATSTAAVCLLVLTLFLVISPPRPVGPAPAAAAPELQTRAQPEPTRAPTGGRGRTSATLAPVVLAPTAPPPPSPEPSAPPTVALASAAAPRTGAPARSPSMGGVPGGVPEGVPGGVSGGTPGGVVGGVPGATGSAPPTPAPIVSVLPLNPPPLAAGSDRFLFRVIAARGGAPLANVCVLYGTLQCGPSDPHTNALGYFWLDLTPGVATNWSFRFTQDGYVSVAVNKTYRSGQGIVVTTVPLRRR